MKRWRDTRNLTPRRALPLLRDVERAVGSGDVNRMKGVLLDVSGALTNHISRGLDKPRRRR